MCLLGLGLELEDGNELQAEARFIETDTYMSSWTSDSVSPLPIKQGLIKDTALRYAENKSQFSGLFLDYDYKHPLSSQLRKWKATAVWSSSVHLLNNCCVPGTRMEVQRCTRIHHTSCAQSSQGYDIMRTTPGFAGMYVWQRSCPIPYWILEAIKEHLVQSFIWQRRMRSPKNPDN